jgi:hypothetical protein
VTATGRGQGVRRRDCTYCDGCGQATMGWPDNLFWEEHASPCGARGWIADARTAPGASRRRRRPQ